ncbi:MAG: hypothetical protein AAF078_07795, partial [Planctomycetota bacterium]
MSRAVATDDVDARRQQFRAGLVKGLVYASGIVAIAFTVGILFSTGPFQAVFPFGSFLTALFCDWQLRQSRVTLAARVMLFADLALITFSGWLDADPFINPGGV